MIKKKRVRFCQKSCDRAFGVRGAKVGIILYAFLEQLRARARGASVRITPLTPYQYRQDPYSSSCLGKYVRSVQNVYEMCTKYVQSVRNMYEVYKMFTKYVQHIYEVYKMCTKYLRSVRNVYEVYEMCTKCTKKYKVY